MTLLSLVMVFITCTDAKYKVGTTITVGTYRLVPPQANCKGVYKVLDSPICPATRITESKHFAEEVEVEIRESEDILLYQAIAYPVN